MSNAEQAEIEITPEGPAPGGALAAYEPLQQALLLRYARLDALRCSELPKLSPTDWRVRLIHKALYSTYRDCEAAGVGAEARAFGARDATN